MKFKITRGKKKKNETSEPDQKSAAKSKEKNPELDKELGKDSEDEEDSVPDLQSFITIQKLDYTDSPQCILALLKTILQEGDKGTW